MLIFTKLLYNALLEQSNNKPTVEFVEHNKISIIRKINKIDPVTSNAHGQLSIIPRNQLYGKLIIRIEISAACLIIRVTHGDRISCDRPPYWS